MSPRPKHRELPSWVQVALVFGAGFAIAWWVSSVRNPRPVVATPEVTASRTADVHTPPPRADRLTALPRRTPESLPTMEPQLSTSAIRKSRLPEWMRFRYEHSHLAFSMESALRAVLDNPVSFHEAAKACAAKENARSVRDLDISAEIEIRDRDATVRSWGCEANEDPALAGRICDCILAHLPEEVRVAVPAQVADNDLVPYEGMLSLRLWL
jgi:hypothetical protein